jgi:hypothetical protein
MENNRCVGRLPEKTGLMFYELLRGLTHLFSNPGNLDVLLRRKIEVTKGWDNR